VNFALPDSETIYAGALYWLAVYGLLLLTYLTVGLAIRWLNRTQRLGARKIQEKHCPAKLIHRDIGTSVRSLATISFFVALGYSLFRIGFGFKAPESVAAQSLSLVGSLLLYDTWFYWGHRLIHSNRLFKRIHAWHHRTVTPTVWSNNSDTFLDNLFLQSYWIAVHFLLPISPEAVLLHKLYDQVTGIIGHSGHEYMASRLAKFPSVLLGTTFHDQHHSRMHYNFANHFSHWDRLMGTITKDYDAKIESFVRVKKASGCAQLVNP